MSRPPFNRNGRPSGHRHAGVMDDETNSETMEGFDAYSDTERTWTRGRFVEEMPDIFLDTPPAPPTPPQLEPVDLDPDEWSEVPTDLVEQKATAAPVAPPAMTNAVAPPPLPVPADWDEAHTIVMPHSRAHTADEVHAADEEQTVFMQTTPHVQSAVSAPDEFEWDEWGGWDESRTVVEPRHIERVVSNSGRTSDPPPDPSEWESEERTVVVTAYTEQDTEPTLGILQRSETREPASPFEWDDPRPVNIAPPSDWDEEKTVVMNPASDWDEEKTVVVRHTDPDEELTDAIDPPSAWDR